METGWAVWLKGFGFGSHCEGIVEVSWYLNIFAGSSLVHCARVRDVCLRS